MTDLRDQVSEPALTLSALGSPEVLEERLALVAAAREAPVRLGVFTDEELAALDDLTLTPAQPSPWLGSLTEEEKQIALTAALRGLTARGVFAAEPVDPADRTYTVHLEPGLAAMLTMRRFVPHLVVAERTTAEFVDWAVFYPQRAGVFLAEHVDRRGLHAFAIAGTDDTVETLAHWVGAFEAARPELDLTLTPSQVEARPEALEPVTEALVATTLTRLVPDQPGKDSWSAVYTGPRGSYAATPAGEAVHYRGIDKSGLATQLRKVLT